MRVGPQFLIAIRLLSTKAQLPAHLTLSSGSQQLHLYCLGDGVLYVENSSGFPAQWLDTIGETAVSNELRSANSPRARIQAFQRVAAKGMFRQALNDVIRKTMQDFFSTEVHECRLKQETVGSHPAIMSLSEVLFNPSVLLLRKMTPEDMLPSKEIQFRQSPDFLNHLKGVPLQPTEGYLLSRLEQPVTVADIVSTVPGDESETKKSLLRLWAFGMLDSPVLNQMVPKIEVIKEAPESAQQQAPATASDAAESPEQLAPMVEEAYSSLSKKDFYSLLGVTNRAELPEIKAAYYKLARRFHPDRFYGMQNPVIKEKVDVIFSAVNVAYETLRHTKRRTEYDSAPVDKRTIGVTTLKTENTNTTLTPETISRVAEEHYRQAQKAYDDGNYYQAVQFLRSATQISGSVAKYWRQLGIALSRNPQWRKEAEDSFNRALELEPRNPENHLYLGFLYKNSGLKLRAKKHFQACRELDPFNEIANRELRLLDVVEEEKEPPGSPAKKGLLGNIFKKK